VDVNIRGWLFTEQKGPYTRRQRLMVALTRQLVGIPNNSSPTTSVSNSRPPSFVEKPISKEDENMISQEAEHIAQKIESDADLASRGKLRHQDSFNSQSDNMGGEVKLTNSSTTMSTVELLTANTNLITRLRPFMSVPLTGTTVSAFFYNDTTSRQKTVTTDAYGHFSYCASLEFIPTYVRILASDELSVQEAVKVIPSEGISVISDIDDTIGHSAITGGAREIFRNIFVRDMDELMIEGVKEWYNKMAALGAEFHYVSNSPWQMFPTMTSYFSTASLPPGSFHLKQYSGMIQGIFEPVAGRKKATLDKLMQDFPQRRFILCGDSGEADLEVYTDVLLEYPGRILGIFIRDVTTTNQASSRSSNLAGSSSRDSLPYPSDSSPKTVDAELPSVNRSSTREAEDLMDFSDDELACQSIAPSTVKSPSLPSKPAKLRGKPKHFDTDGLTQTSARPRPPPPRRSSTNVKTDRLQQQTTTSRSQTDENAGHSHSSGLTNTKTIDSHVKSGQTARAFEQEKSGSIMEIAPALPQRPKPEPSYLRAGANRITEYWSGQGSSSNPVISKKEELWKKRWSRAQIICHRHGVILRSWRVGTDVMDECISIIKNEMERKKEG